jgi:hypothetical protein
MVSNFIALSYVCQALRVVEVKKFYVVVMILVLMFFFDIYWVFFSSKQFGSSVMMIAATKMDLPIKIVWPHVFVTPFKNCSLLGLGDMAVPALAIKFFARADSR